MAFKSSLLKQITTKKPTFEKHTRTKLNRGFKACRTTDKIKHIIISRAQETIISIPKYPLSRRVNIQILPPKLHTFLNARVRRFWLKIKTVLLSDPFFEFWFVRFARLIKDLHNEKELDAGRRFVKMNTVITIFIFCWVTNSQNRICIDINKKIN